MYSTRDFVITCFSTKLFIRFPKTLFNTEDAFQIKKHEIAAIIQSKWKGILARRKYLKMREAAIIFQKYIRRWLAKREAKKRRRAVITIRRYFSLILDFLSNSKKYYLSSFAYLIFFIFYILYFIFHIFADLSKDLSLGMGRLPILIRHLSNWQNRSGSLDSRKRYHQAF